MNSTFLPHRAIIMGRKGPRPLTNAEKAALAASQNSAPEASLDATLYEQAPRQAISGATGNIETNLFGEPTQTQLTGIPGPEHSPANDTLEQITADLQGCTRCKLCENRKTIVVGEGNPKAELVFIGEGPGENEDLEGRPFIGKAGQLLDRMIQAMGLQREQVYICNVIKCHPPGNRDPEADEIEACSQFLARQLDVIRPKVVVALGKFAAQTLLQTDTPITQLRGKFHEFRGAKLMPTFHPAYLLRLPESKREVWADLQQVARELNLEIPKRG